MLSYSITRTAGETDWMTIPSIQIDNILWSEDTGILAMGQLCYNDGFLYVHQIAVEKDIRAENTEPLSPVYEDSCLEFFFMHEGDRDYFNFEINPNGCLIVEYGPSGADRRSIVMPDPVSFFDIQTGRTSDGWEVFYKIPLDFIRSYTAGFRFEGNLSANMYKCGNKTVYKHFLSWAPIDLARPNFHCPEYFGTMIFRS